LSQLAKKDHLDRIDRILLKGVYSNNKKELENPRLLDENQIRHHIYEGIKEFLHQNTGRFESEVNV
jgi:pyoverdine/dityrosine biosynthesis protein Dit1